MSQPIEAYLNRIKVHLKGLPTDEQEQHIEEIKGHLQTLIAAKMLQGSSEEEAIGLALAQFGQPREIGRGIQDANGGSKMPVFQGLVLGAMAGLAVLHFIWAWPILFGVPYNPHSGLGSCQERLVEAALGGAVASLVGRRFTWRYLTRPSRYLPFLAVYSRLVGLGMMRGAVGGAVFGAINTILALYNPNSTVTLVSEIIRYFVIVTLASAVFTAWMVGFLSAIVGLMLAPLIRKSYGINSLGFLHR